VHKEKEEEDEKEVEKAKEEWAYLRPSGSATSSMNCE